MKRKLKCAWCGCEIERYPSQVKKHNFCSRTCLAAYSNKEKNPNGYKDLKDYQNISKHMTELNLKMNPTRMDFPTRMKLRAVRLDKGGGKSYRKVFGCHEHRRVAERKIGRKLRKGEVVHHIDGNKRNNNPNNLEVLKNQSEHAKRHVNRGGDAL